YHETHPLYQDLQTHGLPGVSQALRQQQAQVDRRLKISFWLAKRIDEKPPLSQAMLRIFLANAVHCDAFRFTEQLEKHAQLRQLSQQSINTLLRDVHHSLFDFEHYRLKWLSAFPDAQGSFRSTQKLPLHLEDPRYQQLTAAIEGFVQDVQRRTDAHQTQAQSFFRALCHFFYDLLSRKGTVSDEDWRHIHQKVDTLIETVSHAAAFQDEGMIRDYLLALTDSQEKTASPEILRLASLIRTNAWFWSDTLRNSWYGGPRWKVAQKGYTVWEHVPKAHEQIH